MSHLHEPSRVIGGGARVDEGGEFAPGVIDGPGGVSRREALRVMAASAALAAGGMSGCSRRIPQEIVPTAHGQERYVPGVSRRYATHVTRRGRAMGVVVTSDDARPTKIEGNPDHPASLGATDAIMQAEILSLYDPARSAAVRREGRVADWDMLEEMLRRGIEGTAQESGLSARGGRGLHVVMPACTSPTVAAMVARVRARLPASAWYRHEPLETGNALAGAKLATGRELEVVHDLRRAKAVVVLDEDVFSAASPGGVRHAMDFSAARRQGRGRGELSPRLMVAEAVMTITGARADDRLAVRRSEVARVAAAIAREMGVGGAARGAGAASGDGLSEGARAWAKRGAAALAAAGKDGVLIVGEAQPPAAHALGLAINAAIGSLGGGAATSGEAGAVRLIEPTDILAGSAKTIDECAAALAAGGVEMLLLVGVNPAYDVAAFEGLIGRAKTAAHLGLYVDETARACAWHGPMTHELEEWGDARAFDGTPGVRQPMCEPMYGGRSMLWLMSVLAGERMIVDRELVMAQWRRQVDPAAWEVWWRDTLKAGVVKGTAAQSAAVKVDAKAAMDEIASERVASGSRAAKGSGEFEVVVLPQGGVLDGRYAANAWLAELPDAVTQVTWGTVAMVSPGVARELRVGAGDVVRVSLGTGAEARRVETPVAIVPGVAEGVVGVQMGGGRRAGGDVAIGRGVDIAEFRGRERAWMIGGASVERTGRHEEPALAQLQGDTAGRDVVKVVRAGEGVKAERGAVHLPQYEPLYEPAKMKSGQQWGMTIDLAACIGCGACVVACQAENNVPVVGPEEIRRGRRMHWLRVDRYAEEREGGKVETLFQPLACVHCEAAPCELVCPTGATQHSHDGLNEMNYARCIGTRYCSNNCPYKVRRFNFFHYADDRPAAQRMHNPRVTTRGRGVMEKCTYCVQRIRAAEITARGTNRAIADGEVVTACQGACPTRAIVFGDVADVASAVSKERRDSRAYSLLGELGTRPRTMYLADVRGEKGDATKGGGS